MTTENKIKCVLMDFEINKITLQEATEQILRLFDVVGQSEQFICYKADIGNSRCSSQCRECGEILDVID